MEQEIKKLKKLYEKATNEDKSYVDQKLKELIGFLTKEDVSTASEGGNNPGPPPPHG